jgi:hypothetical protein
VLCGICGRRMQVNYHCRAGERKPTYLCGRLKFAEPACQRIFGPPVDAAIGELVVRTMTPTALSVALAVRDEVQARLDESDRLREQQVRRAQYESDLARRRYVAVDPANRLVADSLEADWNAKLRELADAQKNCERERAADRAGLDEQQRSRILALAGDFPALWNDPATTPRDRKRMLALIMEDVTLVRRGDITAHVRLRGGTTATLSIPAPLTAWQLRTTNPEAVKQLDALLADHTLSQAAAALNRMGFTTGAGKPFSSTSVLWQCRAAGLKSLEQRLRAQGMLGSTELCARLGVWRDRVRDWRRRGLLAGRICNDKGDWLYNPIDQPPEHVQCHARSTRPTPPTAPAAGRTA